MPQLQTALKIEFQFWKGLHVYNKTPVTDGRKIPSFEPFSAHMVRFLVQCPVWEKNTSLLESRSFPLHVTWKTEPLHSGTFNSHSNKSLATNHLFPPFFFVKRRLALHVHANDCKLLFLSKELSMACQVRKKRLRQAFLLYQFSSTRFSWESQESGSGFKLLPIRANAARS